MANSFFEWWFLILMLILLLVLVYLFCFGVVATAGVVLVAGLSRKWQKDEN
jgi:hypothetical protein